MLIRSIGVSCVCGEPEHSMEIGITEENEQVVLAMRISDKIPFRLRLQEAWWILKGEPADKAEVIIDKRGTERMFLFLGAVLESWKHEETIE